MGLLNNNNNRRNKRASLRKDETLPARGVKPISIPNAQPTLRTLPTNTIDTTNTNNMGGGNMMGYMQMAAAATPLVMGLIQGRQQKKLAQDLEKQRIAKDEEIAGLLSNRQEIRNPYANLAVATEAAEFQAQQADQSLANTLDAMQAGGFGAGGATALAREAAKSKQGISADIQKQEVTNQRFFAQGEQVRQNMQEQRSIDDIDFARAQSDNLRQQEMDALTARQASQQAGVGGTMQMAQSIMSNPEAMSQISGLFGG
jgi:hypothetical protein